MPVLRHFNSAQGRWAVIPLICLATIGIGCGKPEIAMGQDEQAASEAPVISEVNPGEITLALGTDEHLIVTASHEDVFVYEEDSLVLPGEAGMTDTFYRLEQHYSDGAYAGASLRTFNVLTGDTDSFDVDFTSSPDQAFADGASRGRAAIEGMVPSDGGLLAYMQINEEGQETVRYEVLLSTDGKVTGCTRIAGEPVNRTGLLPKLKNTSDETLSLSEVYDTKGMDTMQLLAMAGTSDGRLALLYSHGRTSCAVYVLGHDTNVREMSDGENAAEPLQILNFRSASDTYLEKCAAQFSRMTGRKVAMEHADCNDATALNKAVNDMKDGDGPDILIVDSRTLVDVARAGVLQGLFEVLGEDVIDAIFPAVLGNGTVDGALRGIGYRASVRFFMANYDEYQEDTWTARDICALKNNWEDGLGIAVGWNDGYGLLMYMCLMNLDHCGFIDLDAGTCSFDSDEFVELLEFCKKNARPEYVHEMEQMVLDGTAAACVEEGSLINYGNAMNKFGPGYHEVGMPAEDGNKALATCYDLACVNARSSMLEAADEFIRMLVSEDAQIRYSTDWVRSDIILNRSHDKDEGHKSAYFDVGDNASIPLATKPDGSSYAEEYVGLMNAAISASDLYELQDIITEESQAYMNGDRTAREAADIIQNRCKLWISENLITSTGSE